VSDGQRVTADERTGIDVHIEAMSDKSFTLIFTRPGGFWLQADLWATRKPLVMKLFEVVEADDVEIDPEAFK
jgi:hypothetical protein